MLQSLFLTLAAALAEGASAPQQGQAFRHPLLYDHDTSSLTERLTEKLESAPSRDVLRWTITQLGQLGDEAVPALSRVFYRNFKRAELFPAMSNICEALGQTGSKRAIPILLEALSHPSGVVRSRAVDSLVALRDPSVYPYLRTILPLEPKEYRLRLINGMALTGNLEFVEFAEDIYRGDIEGLKELVLTYVADRYPTAGRDFLAGVFRNPPGVTVYRIIAASGLVQFGEPEATEFLKKFAAEGSLEERIKAIMGLGAGRRADLIAPFAGDPNGGVRLAVAKAVGVSLASDEEIPGVSFRRETAIDILKKLAGDSARPVREEAIRKLVSEGDRSPVDPYLAILRDEPDPDRMKEAVELVIDPGILETRAVAIAIERLKRGEAGVKRLMMQVLGALHDPRGVEPLLQVLRESPRELGSAATDEWAAMQLSFLGPSAVKPLIELSQSTSDPRVRAWSIKALVWSRLPEGADFLLSCLENPKEDRALRAFLIERLPDYAGLQGAGRAKRILQREQDAELRFRLNDVLHDYY